MLFLISKNFISPDGYIKPFEIAKRMIPKNNRGYFDLFNRFCKTNIFPPVFSEDNFRKIIALERARSERGNNIFSIIFFEISYSKNYNIRFLINKLYSHLRIIDKFGWCDRYIALILPNTSYENTHKTAQRLCKEAGITQSNCFKINSYPLNWVPENDGISNKNTYAYISSGENELITGNFSSSKESDDRILKSLVNCVKNQLRLREKIIRKFSFFQYLQIPFWKRPIDIIVAIIGLILFSPVMLVIAFAIKCTSKGPVIFTQKRAGLGGKPFDFYKFRSTDMDAESRKKDLMAFNERTGPVFKMTNDPRITLVGKFIRKSSLDELPQFFNVLKGDMCLVGPRPLPVDEDKYWKAPSHRNF